MRLAYTQSDVPGEMNAALRELAERLKARGIRVAGAVQVNSFPDPNVACDMDLHLLPNGPAVAISQDLGAGSSGCRLDPDGLERAVALATSRVAEGVDAVIVNKFGNHEADGRGFRDLIGTALAENIPVVVGVTATSLPAFLAFADGLAERLPCDAKRLGDWVTAKHAA